MLFFHAPEIAENQVKILKLDNFINTEENMPKNINLCFCFIIRIFEYLFKTNLSIKINISINTLKFKIQN